MKIGLIIIFLFLTPFWLKAQMGFGDVPDYFYNPLSRNAENHRREQRKVSNIKSMTINIAYFGNGDKRPLTKKVFQYNENGSVVKESYYYNDSVGQNYVYKYDLVGRMIERQEFNSDTQTVLRDTHYRYDQFGNFLLDSFLVRYDNKNRVICFYNSNSIPYFEISYDNEDRIIQTLMYFTYPSLGELNLYSYDKKGNTLAKSDYGYSKHFSQQKQDTIIEKGIISFDSVSYDSKSNITLFKADSWTIKKKYDSKYHIVEESGNGNERSSFTTDSRGNVLNKKTYDGEILVIEEKYSYEYFSH